MIDDYKRLGIVDKIFFWIWFDLVFLYLAFIGFSFYTIFKQPEVKVGEVRIEVKTYKVDFICEKCGKGHMRPSGFVLTSMPPQYPHVCDKCGETKIFRDISYPYLAHE